MEVKITKDDDCAISLEIDKWVRFCLLELKRFIDDPKAEICKGKQKAVASYHIWMIARKEKTIEDFGRW